MREPSSSATCRKPARICSPPAAGGPAVAPGRVADAAAVRRFARRWQQRIEIRGKGRGFRFRCATVADLDRIRALYQTGFSEFSPHQQLSELSLHRFLRFGETWAIEDGDREIVAFSLLINVADARRTAVSAGIVVHPAAAGQGLGTDLARYSSLAAMAAGSRERRGTLKATNAAALDIFLNKLGAICERYYPRIGGLAEGRLEYLLPLTPASLAGPQIDRQLLAKFVGEGRDGEDYRLLRDADGDALEELYRDGRFRVAAFAPAGLITAEPRLVALPVEPGDASAERRR